MNRKKDFLYFLKRGENILANIGFAFMFLSFSFASLGSALFLMLHTEFFGIGEAIFNYLMIGYGFAALSIVFLIIRYFVTLYKKHNKKSDKAKSQEYLNLDEFMEGKK